MPSSKGWGIGGVVVGVALLLEGCASPEKKTYPVPDLLVTSPIRVRRPPGPSANPKAGPGGADYRTDPPPNENFDCQPVESLFQWLNFAAIRRCFDTFPKPPPPPKAVSSTKNEKGEAIASPPPPEEKYEPAAVVLYKFRRKHVPELELEFNEDETPACIQEVLPRLPVPREIFYLRATAEDPSRKVELYGKDGDPITCYSSRAGAGDDLFLGVRLPKGKFALRVELPPRSPYRTDEEMNRLLASWALTPFFWAGEKGKLQAKIVPEAICKACFANKDILKDRHPFPQIWPAPPPAPKPSPSPSPAPSATPSPSPSAKPS